jgi:outer membrane protein assembly factor BamD (BamD/ComL family)
LLALAGEWEEGGVTVMHRAYDIVMEVAGLIVAVALVGGGLFYMLKKSEDPGKLLLKMLFTVPFVCGCLWLAPKMFIWGPFLIVFMAVVLSFLWTPHIGEWIASPLTGLFDGGNEPPERKPFYSIAMTKRNRGKPREAIAEIRRQLASFPNDFEGLMLLARMQAEDLADLAGAEVTLGHFCEWPGAPMKQVAAAYTQLADWHLKLAADADAARAALQKIIARFPDTETALQAEQRLAHLSDAEKMILAQHDRQHVVLKEGVRNIGLLDSTDFLKPQEVEPGKLAAAHVKHLQAHPHDTEVREQLAMIYGRDFKRLDLATMELAQLINEPKHKPKQIAHWLNLLANLQVELGADLATVRETLEKVVERFPDLPVAELARRRLARLENEFKGLRTASSVKLGTYEQNIGLKYGGPRKQ